MLTDVIGDLLPSAIAVALSPIPSGANPENLALTLAAAASIAEAGLDTADTAIALFIALGSVTVAASVLIYLVAGDRAARPLGALRQFMSATNAVIMTDALLLLGAKLIGDGLA